MHVRDIFLRNPISKNSVIVSSVSLWQFDKEVN
jgi:hypothetical protein